MGHIFISYSHQDKDYVHKLQKALQNEGFDAWIDDRIDYGEEWLKVIEEHLDGCDAFILVMSKNSRESEMVQNEVTRARDNKKVIFPLLLDGRNWLVVQAKQYVNVTDQSMPTEKFFSRLEKFTHREKNKSKSIEDKSVSETFQVPPPETQTAQQKSVMQIVLWGIGFVIIFVIGMLAFNDLNKPQSSVPTSTHTASPSKTPDVVITLTASFTSTAASTSTNTTVPMPTDLPAEITDAKDVSMVLVPSGEFTMGSNADDALKECEKLQSGCKRELFLDEQPEHLVYLGTYYIDKYEVTNTLYKVCVNAGVCLQPSDVNKFSDPQYAQHPVVNVDWYNAKAYCEWRGARLPTEAEWEKAARGTDRRTYPWGEVVSCDFANYAGCIGDTTKVGSYPMGMSPYGVYDLSGNVSEWVTDWYDVYPGGDPNASLDFGQTFRVIRGGPWKFVARLLRVSQRLRTTPDDVDELIGFRCAKDVTTGSASETLTSEVTPSVTDTPDATADGFELISIDEIAYRGGTASAQIRTRPGTYCTLTFFLPSGTMSSVGGVGPCTAGQDGYCSWSWSIRANVTPGFGNIVIIVGDQSESYPIKIE